VKGDNELRVFLTSAVGGKSRWYLLNEVGVNRKFFCINDEDNYSDSSA